MNDIMPRCARLIVFLLLLTALLISVGCGSSKDEGENVADAVPPPTEAPPAAADQAPEPPVWLAASHILIRYTGAARAGAEITRTKEEARALAEEVAQTAKTAKDFAALARERSEGPSAPQGGDLGQFPSDRMVPEFTQAVLTMKAGEVSDPVETPFGFHVIRRGADVVVAGARHIIVMHAESARKPPTITRTKEEALARAEEAMAKVEAGGDFEALAAEYSDGPSAPQGGDLGTFPRGAMVAQFDEALFALSAGGTSKVVETPFGYHIIRRY